MANQVTMEAMIQDYLKRRGIQALVRMVRGADFFEGAERLVEAYGLGSLVPNTILLGNTEDLGSRDRYSQMIAHFHQAQRNVIILRHQATPLKTFRIRQRIDVWWGGIKNNGALMLILAELMRTSLEWREAEVRIKLVVSHQAAAQAAQANLESVVKRLQISALSQVLVAEGRPFASILKSSSKSADLVILGMATPGENFSQYFADLQARTAGLPSTLFVLASEDLAFVEVLQKE